SLERFVHFRLYGERLDESTRVEVSNLVRVDGGTSRDTFLFDLSYEDPQTGSAVVQPCVLQQEAGSSVLESEEVEGKMTGSRRRLETEFKVVRQMELAGIPVPRALWNDTSSEWLGRPFSITSRCAGAAATSRPLDLSDEATIRRIYFEQFIDIL